MHRILLVEDEADIRLIVEHVLIDAGFEVDVSGTVAGGLELLRCRRYDLIVTDLRLPDGTGLDVADAARDRQIKALVMTGYAFSIPVEMQDRYEILMKPLRPLEIARAVEHALG